MIWTREYVVAAIADSPDTQAVAGRLMKNQEDIGNAIVPLYGEDAGKALTDLLKQHISIAADLIEAAKSGDRTQFSEADERWDPNASDIAAFLSAANPNWPEQDVVDLLSQHLALTKDEATARLEQRWEDDQEAFDQIFTEILTVSDVLAAGIIKQFPDKFSSRPPVEEMKASGMKARASALSFEELLEVDGMRHSLSRWRGFGPLVELGDGRVVAVDHTEPFGCSIVW